MTKSYEIIAYAKNTFNSRNAQFTLNGDNEFIEISKGHSREYHDLADAEGCFYHTCTQAEADLFTVHTDVTFELIESWENADEELESRVVCQKSFKVQDAA